MYTANTGASDLEGLAYDKDVIMSIIGSSNFVDHFSF